MVCLAIVLNGKGVLPLVGKEVLEVTSLEEFGYFKIQSNAVKSGVSMVGMELTPLGDVSLRVQIGWLPGPFDSVTHTFHDGDYFHGLNVEVVILEPDGIIRRCLTVVGPSKWMVEGTSIVPCRCSPRCR